MGHHPELGVHSFKSYLKVCTHIHQYMCLVHTLCRVSTEHCLYILLSADLHDPRGVGGEGEGDPRTEVGRDGEGPRGDTGKSGEGVPNSTVGGGGESDFNLLVLGICLVVVGSLMILTAIVITILVLLFLTWSRRKHTLNGKQVTWMSRGCHMTYSTQLSCDHLPFHRITSIVPESLRDGQRNSMRRDYCV